MSFLFYAVLVLWMPLRELLMPRDSTAGRWWWIMRQMALVGAMALAVWLEAWLLRALFHQMQDAQTIDPALRRIGELGLQYLVPAIVLPFVVLLILVICIQILRVILWLWPRRRQSNMSFQDGPIHTRTIDPSAIAACPTSRVNEAGPTR